MNEEILLKLYNKYGLSKVGTFEQFKGAIQTPEGQAKIHAKYLSSVGTLEQFQEAIGAGAVPMEMVDAPQPTTQVPPQAQEALNREVQKATNPLLQVPGLGDFAISAGNQIGSVATDLVPQTIATLQLKGGSARLKELEGMAQNPALATPELLAEIKRLREGAPVMEQEIATQKAESAKKLTGNVQEVTEIGSATDFANWLGNSIGQAAGQIPLSAATLGASSFLMEAATVYDEQLDLLAEKYGISREEVVKQGLDKPAAGEAYAIIAGALDAVSAGSIMKLFKAAAGKEIKKSMYKTILKDMVGEAATEGTQGQLETFGATRGAGTEFNFDLKKFVNEAAAGAVGAGGLTVITSQDSETDKAIKEAKKLALKDLSEDISTGDPALDAELDKAYNEVAETITKITEDVEAFAASKTEKERADAAKAAKEAEAAAKEAADAAFRLEKLAEFNASPTIRQDLPISEEEAQWGDTSMQPAPGPGISEEEAQWADDSAQNVEPLPKTQDGTATVPTGEAPISPATTQQEGQTPTPTVPTSAAKVGQRKAKTKPTVLKLFKGVNPLIQLKDTSEADVTFLTANKADAEHYAGKNAKKEEVRNAGTIEEFTATVNNPLVISDPDSTEAEQARAISKESKEAYIAQGYDSIIIKDEDGNNAEVIIFDRNVPQKKVKVPGKVKLAAPKKIKEKTPEEMEEAAEEKVVKLYDQLNNKKKLKLTAKIREIGNLIEKAKRQAEETGYSGFKDFITDAESELVKAEKAKKDFEEQRAEKKELKEKVTERKAKEAEDEPVKAPVKAKEKLVKYKGKTYKIDDVKEFFFNGIATLVVKEQGQDAINAAINEYIAFRKENGLPETTAEKVRKQVMGAKNDSKYLQDAKKYTSGKYRGATLNQYVEKLAAKLTAKSTDAKAKTAKLRTMTREEIEAEKEAEAAKAFKDELGLDLEDTTFMRTANASDAEVNKYLADNKLSDAPQKEITIDEYIAMAPRYHGPVLRSLARILAKYKGKVGANTKFILLTVDPRTNPPFLGFHAAARGDKDATIAILVNKDGIPLGDLQGSSILLHEYLHDYTKMMFTRAYSLDQGFKAQADKLFRKIKNKVIGKTLMALDRKAAGKTLSAEEITLLNNIKKYTEKGYLIDEVEKGYPEDIDALVDSIFDHDGFYAFFSTDEFLSEIFSNGKTVAFLSQFKMDETIKTGPFKGQQKSALYTWFENLLDWVKEKFNLTPVENNALDYVMDRIAAYDAEFSSAELEEDPNQAPPLEMITEAASKAKKPLTGKQIATKIRNSVIRTLEMKKSIQSENDVRQFIKNLNKKLPAKSQIDEDLIAPEAWKEIQRRRARLKDDLNTVKVALDWMKKQPEYKENGNYTYMVDLYEQVDFTRLNAADRHAIIDKGIVPLAHNNINVGNKAHNIVLKNVAEQRTEELAKIAPKVRKGRWMRLMYKATNPMTSTSAMGKFNTAVANKLVKIFHADFLWAATKAGVVSNEFYQKLEELADKHKLTHKNLAKIGMYGRIFSTKTNPIDKAKWENEVREAAKFVLESAKAKEQAFVDKTYNSGLSEDKIKKEVEIAQELYDKVANKTIFFPGQLPSGDPKNILTPGELAVYNAIREFATKHEPSFFRNAKAVWGQEPKELYNYFPSLAQGKLGLTNSEDIRKDELIRGGADNLYEALSSDNKYAKFSSVHGKKVWSTYERKNNPQGYYYEFDALGIGKRWSKTMLFDTYASTPLKLVDKVLKSNQTKKVFGAKDLGAIEHQIKTTAGAGMIYDPNAGAWLRKFMKFRDALYMSAIVSSGQWLLQMSSGVAASAVIAANINPARMASTMAKATRAASMTAANMGPFKKFLEENGLGIQLRDVGFEKYLSPEDFQSTSDRVYGKVAAKMQNLSDLAIRAGDKLAARMVWFAAYFDAGGTIEKPNKDAILHAERITGTLQNMSDARWTAPMFRSNNVYKKVLMGMIYAYKSFSLNAWLGMVSSVRNINNKEARMIGAAQFGSYIAYHAMSVALIRPLWKAIGESLGGDDEDDEEEKNYTKAEELATNVSWDLIFGSWSPGVLDQMLRWGVYETGIAQKVWGEPDEEFDRYADSPLFAPSKPQKIYESVLGPGTKELIMIPTDLISAMGIYSAAWMADESLTEDHQFKASQHLLNAASDMVGGITIAPFRGDMRRIMKSIYNQRRDDARRAKELMGRGGNVGTDLDMNSMQDSPDIIDMTELDAWTNESADFN